MHPYYTFKDLITIFLFFLILTLFVFYAPNKLGQEMAVQQCKLLYYNNAICWDSLNIICTRNISASFIFILPFSVKINNITNQSAGNQCIIFIIQNIINLRINYQKIFSKNLIKSSFYQNQDLFNNLGSSETICVNSYSEDLDKFNYWLAGLIDGDGSLLIYKNGACSCEITLGEEDIKTLHKIKNKFYGSITKRSKTKAYRWRIYKKIYLLKVIEAINNKLLTNEKHLQLIKICNKLNIEPKINNKFSNNNPWFSGFFDAEGYFSIRNKYTLTISVTQKSKDILENIKNGFGFGNIYYDISWKGYNYVVTDLTNIKLLLKYFEKFPLQTVKHIDYITFKRLVLFIERGYHLKNNPNKSKIDNLIKSFKKRKNF